MIRREHFRVAMPVLARRRHEVSKPTQKLVRREVDHALGIRSRSLAEAEIARLARHHRPNGGIMAAPSFSLSYWGKIAPVPNFPNFRQARPIDTMCAVEYKFLSHQKLFFEHPKTVSGTPGGESP
jgi:hypothetical protein